MLNVIEDIVATLRALDTSEQERAAQILHAWLNGSSELGADA
jgi:hypothetical protein